MWWPERESTGGWGQGRGEGTEGTVRGQSRGEEVRAGRWGQGRGREQNRGGRGKGRGKGTEQNASLILQLKPSHPCSQPAHTVRVPGDNKDHSGCEVTFRLGVLTRGKPVHPPTSYPDSSGLSLLVEGPSEHPNGIWTLPRSLGLLTLSLQPSACHGAAPGHASLCPGMGPQLRSPGAPWWSTPLPQMAQAHSGAGGSRQARAILSLQHHLTPNSHLHDPGFLGLSPRDRLEGPGLSVHMRHCA